MLRITAGAFFVLALATASSAQSISPDRARARELVNLVVTDETLQVATRQGVEALLQIVLAFGREQGQPALTPAQVDRVRTAATEVLTRVIPPEQWREAFENTYLQHFTGEEIDGILRFYRTSLGAKLLAKQATLMAEGNAIGRTLFQRHESELQRGIEEALRAGPATTAPSGAGSSRPMRVGDAIAPPTKIRDVPPVYPNVARASRIQGAVVISAVIGPDGRVTDAQALSGPNLLIAPALDAVRQWVYSVTTYEGKPVAVTMTVTVTFSLD